MKRKIFSILFALLLVLSFSLVLALPVGANLVDTYYVSTTGDNGNNGLSWGTAWQDIQYANSQAVYGDTINVAAGTYYEHITLKDGVEVLGAGASVTTINGGGSGTVVTANGVDSETKLDGFTITNGSATNGGGMYNYNSSSPVVTNCTFSGNSAAYGGGMLNDINSPPTVTNCIFSDNSASMSGGGMYNQRSLTTVTNCTFSGNSATYGGGMYSYDSTPVVTNCILWDGGGEIYNNTSTPVVTYCDIQGGYTGTGNIDADPLFVGAGDYHLQPGSPCIDVGNNAAPSLPSTDFEGDPRILNGVVDMGVDEYVPHEVWVDDDWQIGVPPYDEDTDGDTDFATIKAAIAAVASGGTVHVHPGTYNEKGIVIDKSLTVQSVSGDWHDTIVDPIAGPVFEFATNFSGDATISGFTIAVGTLGIYIDGLADTGTINITDCLIYDNGTGIFASGTLDGDIFIDDCIISDNGAPATGIHLYDILGTVEITDSVIGAYWDAATSTSYSGNAGNGIEIVRISESGNVLLDNNKIVNNTGNGIEDDTLLSGVYGRLTITNNIIGAYDYDLTSGDGYFTGNGNHGISIAYVSPDGVVTIDGNKIAQNGVDGIEFGVGLPVEGDVTINNNYIGAWTQDDGVHSHQYTGNGSKGINVFIVAPSGSMTIINNKIAENALIEVDFTGVYIGTTSGDTVISANHVGSWTQDIPGGEVTYQGNGGPGILVQNVLGGSLLINGNTVANNIEVLSGIHIDAANEAADVSVNLNDILSNGGYGVYYNYGGAGCLEYIDAENNWWGDVSGPGGEGLGTGDEVSTNVDYEPWLEVSVEDAKAGTITDGTLDAMEGVDTEVLVDGSATVTVAKYSGNPGSGFSGDIGKYIDVHIDDPSGVNEIEIRVYYTAAEISGKVESSLALRWWDGDSWEVCSDSGVNTTDIPGPPTYSGYMWAKIRSGTTPNLTQLSETAFGGRGSRPGGGGGGGGGGGADTTPPRISNISHCDEGITETTADICWITNEPSTSQVEYGASPSMLSPLDETYVIEHNVTLTGLTPGTTYHYKTMSKDRAGNLAVSDVYTFTTLGTPATFALSNLSVSPTEVDIGESVTISVVVANTGDASGSYTVMLKINGVVEATKDVTVDAGVSGEVTFTTAKDVAGSYSVDVNGLSGSFTVKEEPVPTPTPTPTPAKPFNWPLAGGIIAGVVIIGLLIFFVARRRAA